MNQNDATTHCHDAYAHGYIAKLFLKEFGSIRVSYNFNTTAIRKFLEIDGSSSSITNTVASPQRSTCHVVY